MNSFSKGKILGVAACSSFLLASISSLPASAADLGGDCCADLEERIAELEATTARKGNRKVSLTISGQISQSIMWFDDGKESNAYVVSNFGNPSYLLFTGEAEITKGWKAGFNYMTYVGPNFTGNVGQGSDEGGTHFFEWLQNWYIVSEKYGKLTMGLVSRATDLVPEQDLSGSIYDPSYSLVSDWGFLFQPRRNDGALSGLFWGSFAGYSYTGETGDLVRYDSPTWQGFTFSASWGEDDMSDVALFYAKEHGQFSVAAAVGYSHVTDERGIGPLYGNVPETPGPSVGVARLETDTWVASGSILHTPSGLSFTLAGGEREYDGSIITDADGAIRTPENSSYIWGKVGLITKPFSFGNTNWYAEYGRYWDALSSGQDPAVISTLSVSGTDTCAGGAGQACRIAGSDAEVWGLGVAQAIDAASMTLHLGYRHWEGDVDLVDVNGTAVQGVSLEDFDSVLAGARITF